MGMTDPEPVRFMHLLFGGSCTIRPRPTTGGKTVYRWAVCTRKAELVAKSLLPFVRSVRKAGQLETVINYVERRRREGKTRGWKLKHEYRTPRKGKDHGKCD